MPQQIEKINQEKLYTQFYDVLVQEGNNMFLSDNYKVECSNKPDKYLWAYSYYKIFETPDCEISKYIKLQVERGSECRKKNKYPPKKEHHTHDCKPEPVCNISSSIGITDW